MRGSDAAKRQSVRLVQAIGPRIGWTLIAESNAPAETDLKAPLATAISRASRFHDVIGIRLSWRAWRRQLLDCMCREGDASISCEMADHAARSQTNPSPRLDARPCRPLFWLIAPQAGFASFA